MSSPKPLPAPACPFHLAFPVSDLEATRHFYAEVLGCGVGRESALWIDFDFWGHQITAHLSAEADAAIATNPVDGETVPVRHFGAVLSRSDWDALRDRLTQAGLAFLIPPTVRHEGQPGEQATLFIRDPSGNALEFKSMADPEALFAR